MTGLGFTPASERDVFSVDAAGRPGSAASGALSGQEARRFYESLTSDGGRGVKGHGRERRDKQRRRRRAGAAASQPGRTGSAAHRQGEGVDPGRSSESERSAELQGLRFLRCAHEGDVSGLTDLLSKGVDINFQDTFFWTAVMCAAWSGRRDAVRLLLQRGAAWVGVVDTQGRDARDLALEAGRRDVLEELDGHGTSAPAAARPDDSAPRPQWCDVCGSEYSGGAASHLSSTLHQFSLRRPPPTPLYCLPPSSKSYRMMVRCGWTPGAGLGPGGGGPRGPVPTVLKRDQKGLGYGPAGRARVTHFGAGDRNAVVKPRPRGREGEEEEEERRGGRGKRREESRRREREEKTWERDFRTSFYL